MVPLFKVLFSPRIWTSSTCLALIHLVPNEFKSRRTRSCSYALWAPTEHHKLNYQFRCSLSAVQSEFVGLRALIFRNIFHFRSTYMPCTSFKFSTTLLLAATVLDLPLLVRVIWHAQIQEVSDASDKFVNSFRSRSNRPTLAHFLFSFFREPRNQISLHCLPRL